MCALHEVDSVQSWAALAEDDAGGDGGEGAEVGDDADENSTGCIAVVVEGGGPSFGANILPGWLQRRRRPNIIDMRDSNGEKNISNQ